MSTTKEASTADAFTVIVGLGRYKQCAAMHARIDEDLRMATVLLEATTFALDEASRIQACGAPDTERNVEMLHVLKEVRDATLGACRVD